MARSLEIDYVLHRLGLVWISRRMILCTRARLKLAGHWASGLGMATLHRVLAAGR